MLGLFCSSHILNISTNLNSRDSWGWKGSLEVILSKPPTQAGSPRVVFQDHVHMAFEHLWGRKFHYLSRWPVTVLSQPRSIKLFPDVQRAQSHMQSVPIASGPVTGHHWEVSVSTFFAPSLQVFIIFSLDKIPNSHFANLLRKHLPQFLTNNSKIWLRELSSTC